MTEKAVKAVLGASGRVWKTPTGYEIGFETNPGRNVIGKGTDLLQAWSDAFLDQNAIAAEAQRIEARTKEPIADLTTGLTGAFPSISEVLP